MDADVIYKMLYILMPLVIGIGAYFVRSQVSRIERLEDRMLETVTKDELREEVDTKIQPIKESIDDIKTKLDKLYDFLINRKH